LIEKTIFWIKCDRTNFYVAAEMKDIEIEGVNLEKRMDELGFCAN
jgi:hypothetical protein